jgi:hypothetical protein
MLSGKLKDNLQGLKSKLEDLEKVLCEEEKTGTPQNKSSQNKASQNIAVKTFLNSEEKINSLLEKGKTIKLNIGGKIFMTNVSNILNFKESLFAKSLIDSPNELFFDRSYKNFKVILNFLREKKLNMKKLDRFEKDDILEELEYYGLNTEIQISKKVEYDLNWDIQASKSGACSMESENPKNLKVHTTTCYTHFVTDKTWTDENIIIELESKVQQTDNYLYYGIVNENYDYTSNCMCCSPSNAYYVQCNGAIKLNSISNENNPKFNFGSRDTIIGMRINFAEKTLYFYIPDEGEAGPFTIQGNTFKIVSGHCNGGTGIINILSCYKA